VRGRGGLQGRVSSIGFGTRLLLARRYVHLARRYRAKPLSFARRRAAFYESYWSCAAARAGGEVEDLGEGLLRIRRGARLAWVRYHHVALDSYFARELADDKAFVSWLVRQHGFLAPRYAKYTLRSIGAARDFLARADGPCVVKPVSDSSGRGITTRITSPKRLVEASLAASAAFTLPSLMIEEEQPGDCYRLLYLDGRLLHAVKRGRPTVLGDGASDIRELVRRENEARLNEPVLQSLCGLTPDLELRYALADQGLGLGAVPAAGRAVVVKNVSNQNGRRDQSDVTGRVHPAYSRLATKVMRALSAHLIGIDVMSRDISASPAESGSAVLEINIPPGLHYHELVAGKDGFSDVGATLLAHLLDAAPSRRSVGIMAIAHRHHATHGY
jgi:D-alanine-D-alanine ligase-like ATP-grasp enzyme